MDDEPYLPPVIPIVDDAIGPQFSGLYDQYGNKLYRTPFPIGFQAPEKPRRSVVSKRKTKNTNF